MSGSGSVIPLRACRSLYPSFVTRNFLLIPLPLTPHSLRLLDLFHLLHLIYFFQMTVEGHPGARHLGVHFTQSPFSHAAAGTVAHKFRTLGFGRIVWNWRALMDSTGMLSTFIFPRDN